MKPSVNASIVLVFISALAWSQNYQTIKSDEINYFAAQNHDYFLASRIDNVEIQGSDSIFRSFQTVRDVSGLQDGDPCKYYLGDSWMGPKMVIKPNGQNIFYNYKDEPIYVETLASLNDTFLVYTYPSGHWIKGVVDNHVKLSIFGVLDSVKIINLFSNIPLQLEEPRFILSKDHGFVEWFAPYTFPQPYIGTSSVTGENDYPSGYLGNFELVGINSGNNSLGFAKPTHGDIFGYEIGDEIKMYASVEEEDGSFTETYTERKIVNKFLWDPDSVLYFVKDVKREIYYPPNGPSVTTVLGGPLETVSYKNLDLQNTPYLPEEFNGTDGWTSLFINDCGDIQEVVHKEAISWSGADSCITQELLGSNLLFSTINGVGILGTAGIGESGSQIFTSELVYYSRSDGSECGTNQFLAVKNEPKFVGGLKVYPNPTQGDLIVELNNTTANDVVKIVDKAGRLIRTWKVGANGSLYLDVSDLNVGMYMLVVENQGAILRQKLIKN